MNAIGIISTFVLIMDINEFKNYAKTNKLDQIISMDQLTPPPLLQMQ